MVKMFLKKKSKRVTAKKRYKIEKKVREHNRKIKKADKLKKQGKKGKKLIIVPGNCPFKEQILAESTLLKENMFKERMAKKEQIKADRQAKREELLANKKPHPDASAPHNRPVIKMVKAKDVPANGEVPTEQQQQQSNKKQKDKPTITFQDMLKKATERGYLFEQVEQRKSNVQASGDPSLKAFYKEFQTVVSESDVVIQVLDSRDPLGTRSSDAEEAVRNHTDKKLLLVLNKCDLVPPENLQKWISYLKQTTNCAVVAFKANTQKQKDRLGAVGAVNTLKGNDTKKSVGVGDLMGILGTWARGSAGGITVGVIGMPNVGKSSLINSLKRSKACNVGAKPGITRTCQVIHLDSKLRLIDSPGICFSKETGNEAISLEKILARVPKSTLMLHYRIPDFNDPEEFLCNIATKYGQLKKGGIPNTGAAENKLVQDWHTGAIRFFTEPPELASTTTSAAIVSTLAAPFSLGTFMANTNDQEMKEDDAASGNNDEDDDEEMSDDEDETTSVMATPPPKNPKQPSPRLTRSQAKKKGVTFSIDTQGTDLLRRRKSVRRQQMDEETISPTAQKKLGLVATKTGLMKKIKKSKKKSAKKADELSEVIQNMSF